MTLEQDVLPGVADQHRCAGSQVLAETLDELLAETKTAEEFRVALSARTSVMECQECRFALIELASERADRERDAFKSSFRTFEPSTICQQVLASRPRAWPPDRRWPELEAIAEDAMSRREDPGARRLLTTLRDLAAVASREGQVEPRVNAALTYLRRHLSAASSSAQLGIAACLSNDASLMSESFRRASLGEDDANDDEDLENDRELWDLAAAFADGREPRERSLRRPPHPSGIRLPEADVPADAPLAAPPAVARVRPFNPGIAFRLASSIEEAVAKLEELEATATRACAEIVARGFPFAAVSLIRIEDGTIEAIAGAGAATEWVGRVRHPIHPDLRPEMQDIQSNIVLTCRAEMVEPSDARLDPFVRDHFKHTERRYFIPLLIAYDHQGRYIDHQEECHWEKVDGSRWLLQVRHQPGVTIRVFGTLEIGIGARGARVDDLLELANEALQGARQIYACTVARVFDTVVTLIRKLSGAKSATLHHGREERGNIRWAAHYCFRSELGKAPCLMTPANREGTIGGNPRPGGLGELAVHAGRPRTRAGEELREANPIIYAEGIRSMVALPLRCAPEMGVVFLHREEAEKIRPFEMRWIWFLARRAAASIRIARAYTEERDRRFELIGQHKAAKAMFEAVDEPAHKLAQVLTGSMLNLSTADIGLLFRVDGAHDDEDLPCRDGKRLADEDLDGGLLPLVREVASMGSACSFEPAELSAKARARLPTHGLGGALRDAGAFLDAERINFLEFLPLKHDTDVMGVLVLAYRRSTAPRSTERRNLELVASTASVALMMGTTVGEDAAAKQFATRVGQVLEAFDPPPPSRSPSARSQELQRLFGEI